MDSESPDRVFHARRRSRRLALQALYQWCMTQQEVGEIEGQFFEQPDIGKADPNYFSELIRGVVQHTDILNQHIRRAADREASEIDPVERAVLQIAVYELLNRADIPYKVVINEAVELTKKFGAEQGHVFINAVLDRAASDLRSTEIEREA